MEEPKTEKRVGEDFGTGAEGTNNAPGGPEKKKLKHEPGETETGDKDEGAKL